MKRWKRIALACALLPLVLVVYASVIETRWLEVTEHKVIVEGLAAPLTIAHVSDLHIDEAGALEEKTLAAIRAVKPDLIVITGDLYDRASSREPASRFLEQLVAPLGVWFAPGNWEHWVDLPPGTPFIDAHNATILTNASARLRDDVWIAGFDDALAGTPRPDDALAAVPSGAVVIGIFHSPSLFSRVADRIDLALAGHTHGGQVRIPGLGALVLPPASRPFVSGWYTEGRAQMFVSRGLGTSVLPVRFACRPELAIVHLVPVP